MIRLTRELDQRARDVLESVIHAYIRSAVPVSSRQLTKVGGFDLSPASLRNAMADLEDLGFLTHPHVSAGRVPTDLGYRTFIEELMTRRAPSQEEKAQIEAELSSESPDLDRFLHGVSRLLSRLTGEVALIAVRAKDEAFLRSVHFTRIADRKLVVIRVTEAGLVDSRLVETREDFPQDELEAAGRRLTVDYGGKSLSEIRCALLEALAEEKAHLDLAFGRILELGRTAFSASMAEGDSLVVEGTETILGKPEFQKDVDGLRRMFRTFDEKARLVSLLTDCLTAESGPAVVIGSENPLTDEAQCAVVATAYRKGGRVAGVLGVVGPRRMDILESFPMVDELGKFLSRRLTEGAL